MPRVVVLGSINMDAVVTVDSFPFAGQEMPARKLQFAPGGKGAIQAVAAARMDVPATILGCVGRDAFGRELLRFLRKEGIDVGRVTRVRGRSSGTAIIIVDRSGANTIIFRAGPTDSLLLCEAGLLQPNDVLISQFEVPYRTLIEFYTSGRERQAVNIFNAAPAGHRIGPELRDLIDIIVMNELELSTMTEMKFDNHEMTVEAARELPRYDGQAIVVTLGGSGAVVVDNNGAHRIRGYAVKPVDTTGAGDTFIGTLGAELSRRRPLLQAAQYANLSAAVSVTRGGSAASAPTRREIEEAIAISGLQANLA